MHKPDPMSWEIYWDQESIWTSPKIYELSAALFLKGIQNHLRFEKHHRVLNIGCGLGYLERQIAPQIDSIIGIDRSPRMIHRAQDNCKDIPSASFYFVPQPDFQYKTLSDRQFHFFFCISVAQYFSKPEDLLALIDSVQKLAAPGAKLILADLPQNHGRLSPIKEAALTCIQALQYGYFAMIANEILHHFGAFREYRKQVRRRGQIDWSVSLIEKILRQRSLSWEILKTPLSICPNRLNALIHL